MNDSLHAWQHSNIVFVSSIFPHFFSLHSELDLFLFLDVCKYCFIFNETFEINKQSEFALEYKVDLISNIVLLVKNLAISHVHMLQLVNDATYKILASFVEEIYFADDWAVGFVDD